MVLCSSCQCVLLVRMALCSFDKEHSLGVMPMHNIDLQALFSVTALLNLVLSLMPQAVFVLRLMSPLSKDETCRRCSPM